ncbi:carbohydrate ABC transporter permease [Alicyclobacillus acidiphilus]|uniref:carbohydrate ABC transporter permease n=1 Tax=Alicyclobacillus acidiphilus TaxID=182455 RepID=UPI0009FB1904|nr:sugar ABC transporter permease [Alicyclobacillus acidiphilus]
MRGEGVQVDFAETTATSTGAKASRKRRSANRMPVWMLFPTLFLLLLIIVVPFLIAVYTSLIDLNQYTLIHWVRAPFVGLGNFIDALKQGSALGASALRSVWVSVSFSLVTTAIITPVGVMAALMVNKPFRGRKWIRALFLLPYVLPVFVIALVWRLLFLNGTGLIDQVLSWLHIANKSTYWLIGPHTFWAMVIADAWGSWPFIYLMVLAALQGISTDQYESAYMDGAGPVRSFFSITVPNIRSILGLAVLLSTLNHFNNFTLPFIMFGTPPSPQADVLPLNVYITSFQTFNFGLGAAMSIITLIIMMIPAIFYIRMLKIGEGATR